MRTTNRLSALLLALLLLVGMTACGGKEELSLGRWEEDIYHNDMLSIHFRVPSGWHIAGDTEAEELLGNARTLFSGKTEEELKTLEKNARFDLGYAFVLVSESGRDRCDLLFQKCTDKSDAAAYIASAKKQLESYADLWEMRTISNDTVTIRGRNYVSLEMLLSNGDNFLRYYYCTTVVNGYFVTFILTTSDADYSFESFLNTLESASAVYYGEIEE